MTRSLLSSIIVAALVATTTAQGGKYKTYKEAYAAGTKAIKAGDLTAAREPLETAAKLAGTAADRSEAHRTLLTVYRELPDNHTSERPADFILPTTTRPAGRSRNRGFLVHF